MTPADLLARLEAEGVGVSLNLKFEADEKPSDDTRALIREHRDALLEHLARERVDTLNRSQSPGLTLYGDLLHSLMVWTARYHELRLERPGAVVLNARPEHIRDAAQAHPWGVVYNRERYQLLHWGDVPGYALQDLRDLEADEPLASEQVAA